VVEPPRAAPSFGRAGIEHHRRVHEVLVVIEEIRHRRARLVADRRETGPASAPWRAPSSRSSAGCAPVSSDKSSPVESFQMQIILEQVLLRRAVARAFARTATRQLPRSRSRAMETSRSARNSSSGGALRCQRPQHRRAQEVEVVVVARIADRPTGPRIRHAAPRRLRGMPEVEERLIGKRRPTFRAARASSGRNPNRRRAPVARDTSRSPDRNRPRWRGFRLRRWLSSAALTKDSTRAIASSM
jgi:hypothetical protein